jgi:protein-disulfide isomerase
LGLPLAVWGVAGYSLLTLLILFSAFSAAQRKHLWAIFFATGLLLSFASIGLGVISAFFISSWCILCIATYAINFLLAILSWIIRRRFKGEPFATAFAQDLRFLRDKITYAGPIFGVFWISLISAILWFPNYWDIKQPGVYANIRSGLTKDGLPWTGAESPDFEIVEFTDYQCFQCRKMHYYLLQLVARHPDKIRVIHRHFPMDHEFNPIVRDPFHVGSGRMAILAIHAAFKAKFSEMNDWLFFKAGLDQEQVRLTEAGAATGINVGELAAALQNDRYRLLLKRDIHEGIRLGVAGTPSYLVKGKIYEGNLPAEVVKLLLKPAGMD